MSQIKVDQITDELGTGSPSFPNGVDAADLTGNVDAALLTGTLPAIDGSALTGVGGSTTAGDVGTYGFLGSNAGVNINFGGTIAGSSLPRAASNKDGYTSAASLSGTWRCMGSVSSFSGTDPYAEASQSLFVRVS